MEKKYYYEINIARGIAVILVLLGHSFPDAQTGISNDFAYYIFRTIYSFHMPLFFILSGFLFYSKFISVRTWGDYKKEIQKRFTRLLIPYFFYAIVTAVLKFFFAKYANNSYDYSQLWKIFLGDTPNGGLWFLWTLFVVTLIFLFLNRCNIYVLFLCSLLLYCVKGFCPEELFFVKQILKYALYFAFGLVMYKNYSFLCKLKHKNIIALSGFAILLIINYASNTDSIVYYLCSAFIGSMAVITISFGIVKHNGRIYRLLSTVADYGMDIYLLSYYVQVPIRVICINFIQVPYICIVLLMFLCGGVIPYFVSRFIIRKSRILSRLLIGK